MINDAAQPIERLDFLFVVMSLLPSVIGTTQRAGAYFKHNKNLKNKSSTAKCIIGVSETQEQILPFYCANKFLKILDDL